MAFFFLNRADSNILLFGIFTKIEKIKLNEYVFRQISAMNTRFVLFHRLKVFAKHLFHAIYWFSLNEISLQLNRNWSMSCENIDEIVNIQNS